MKGFLLLLCVIAAFLAGALASAGGFVVFAGTAAYNYEASGRSLKLVSVAPAWNPKETAACAGRLFVVEPLLNRVCRLGADLREDRRFELGRTRGVMRILGSDERRIFVFFDNILAAFDPQLKPAGRAALEAQRRGEIVPVITPDDFRVFADRGFILSKNTGDVFAVDLKNWTAKRLSLERAAASHNLKVQWIDPEKMTLNVLVARQTEERSPELAPGETRIIKSEYVETFDIKDLNKPPEIAKLHEEREIYKPYPAGFMEEVARKNAQGIIIDYDPPTRPEGSPQGVSISRLSRTTPAFALVYQREGGKSSLLGAPDLVALGSGGKFEKIERFREDKHGAVWFKRANEVRFVVETPGDRGLDILLPLYQKLLEEPPARELGASVLAY